jgi:hypothetical protein
VGIDSIYQDRKEEGLFVRSLKRLYSTACSTLISFSLRGAITQHVLACAEKCWSPSGLESTLIVLTGVGTKGMIRRCYEDAESSSR